VPAVVNDRHVRRQHHLVADPHLVPHVNGNAAIQGHVVADRQPGTACHGDAHVRGVAERGELVTEDRLAADVQPDLPPDIRKPAEPRRGQHGPEISTAALDDIYRYIVKTKVCPQHVTHRYLCQVVMSGRHETGGRVGLRHGRRLSPGFAAAEAISLRGICAVAAILLILLYPVKSFTSQHV